MSGNWKIVQNLWHHLFESDQLSLFEAFKGTLDTVSQICEGFNPKSHAISIIALLSSSGAASRINISALGFGYPKRLEKLFSISFCSHLMFTNRLSNWLHQNYFNSKLIHASKTRRFVRYSPYCFSSFSFRTRKVLPGKSGPYNSLENEKYEPVPN